MLKAAGMEAGKRGRGGTKVTSQKKRSKTKLKKHARCFTFILKKEGYKVQVKIMLWLLWDCFLARIIKLGRSTVLERKHILLCILSRLESRCLKIFSKKKKKTYQSISYSCLLSQNIWNFQLYHHFMNTTLRVGLELKAPAWESRASTSCAHQWLVRSTFLK